MAQMKLADFRQLGETFDSTKSYEVGDYCYYAGIMYECIASHTGAWNALHFVATDISSELSSINDALDITTLSAVEWEQGNLSSSTGATSSTNQSKRVRTPNFFTASLGISFTVPNGYQVYVYKYTSDVYTSFIGTGGAWKTGSVKLDGGLYYRLVASKANDTDLTPDEVSSTVLSFHNITDPTLTLEGKCADAKATGDSIASIQELAEFIHVTEGINRNAAGVKFETYGDKLKIYETATSNRTYCGWNGQDGIRTTTSTFTKTLDAGTYHFTADATGYQSAFDFRYTYTTFADAVNFISNTQKEATVTFTAPVMIGIYIQTNRVYGTSENPTYISFSAKRVSATDLVARDMIAPTESTSTASQNYAVGSFLIYQSELYKVTSPIAYGETIVVGTNVTATTIKEDIETKAATDGTYSSLTAGQILSDNYTEDKVPYLFRETGASATQEFDEIVGGTVSWNQLAQNGNFANGTTGWTTTTAGSVINGVYTIVPTESSVGTLSQAILMPHDHVIMIMFDFKTNVDLSYTTYSLSYNSASISNCVLFYFYDLALQTGWNKICIIFRVDNPSNSINTGIRFATASGTPLTYGTVVEFKNINAFDLTQMLGATIADYIHANRGTSRNESLAILQSWGFFTKDYYPYDAGSLMSVKTTGHVMRDADDGIIASYPLDDVELRGVPKLSDNKLYYDGDTYKSDGTVTRKYGIVDLGTLTWSAVSALSSAETGYAYTASLSGRRYSATSRGVCVGYTFFRNGTSSVLTSGIENKQYGFYQTATTIMFRDDAYTTKAAFKEAVTGKYLVYELATETTESADPFTTPQVCDEYGTEEYIDTRTVPIPVGHNTRYPENLKKKIEGLPWDLSMIAPIENGTTASQAYAIGKYFMRNNQFCKAKTAIASGATFTLNTNYEVTTVADELYTALQ